MRKLPVLALLAMFLGACSHRLPIAGLVETPDEARKAVPFCQVAEPMRVQPLDDEKRAHNATGEYLCRWKR